MLLETESSLGIYVEVLILFECAQSAKDVYIKHIVYSNVYCIIFIWSLGIMTYFSTKHCLKKSKSNKWVMVALNEKQTLLSRKNLIYGFSNKIHECSIHKQIYSNDLPTCAFNVRNEPIYKDCFLLCTKQQSLTVPQ